MLLTSQVTTHSRLLITTDALQLAKLIGLKRDSVVLRSLQAFDTEQQFCKMLKYRLTHVISLIVCRMSICDSGIHYVKHSVLTVHSRASAQKHLFDIEL